MTVTIRRFTEKDAAATAQLYFDAVRIGGLGPYSEAETVAWVKEIPEIETWRERLSAQSTFIAEQAGDIIGFLAINDAGYIDLAFVAPEVQGQGVAFTLYKAAEKQAVQQGLSRLTAHASLLAHPFFLRQGWTALEEEWVERHGQVLRRFYMEKNL
ncbi:MAG: GNAT family N-acetyltransferase [Proteobacteria bacterium]|nr:GNAT family N-acetyltransferase [Pseudomonadota bacterium]